MTEVNDTGATLVYATAMRALRAPKNSHPQRLRPAGLLMSGGVCGERCLVLRLLRWPHVVGQGARLVVVRDVRWLTRGVGVAQRRRWR